MATPDAPAHPSRPRSRAALPAALVAHLDTSAGRSADWRSATGVGVAGAVALVFLSALVRHEPTPRGDDLIYARMADHPFGTHTFPFGYRVGLPWLVHVLPFSHQASFTGLTFVAAGGAAAFAYLLIQEVGASARVAAGLAVLMCVSPPFLIVALRHGHNTDVATVLFMMAGTYFAVTRRLKALAVTLLVGVTVREAELFLIPLAYALWAQRWWDRRAARDVLLVASPAVAAFVALHLGVHTVGKNQVPGYGGSLVSERFTVVHSGLRSAATEARRLFTVYGPLWLVAPLALASLRFARRGLVLVAASLASMTFALDWGRMILLSAPVFYPASAYVLSRRRSWVAPAFAGLALLAVGYAIYMDHRGVRTGIIDNPAPPYPVR